MRLTELIYFYHDTLENLENVFRLKNLSEERIRAKTEPIRERISQLEERKANRV